MDITKLKQLAHDLVIDGCHEEYLRGISELIAEVDGVEDVPHEERSQQIAEEIYHSPLTKRDGIWDWWNKLTPGFRVFYADKYIKDGELRLSSRDIELIYKKEHP